MERRSWPWKKKSSKNSGAIASTNSVAPSANASPANQSSRRFEDHGMSKFLAEQVQEGTLRFQEAEEKLRALNAKLAAAEAELIEKENLVKQHTKVAEDAVSGWERAEEETASVKLQLETTTNKLESKISQLESTVKDSQRTLQKTKEDHDRKLQELNSRKNKELDRTRQELESRLSEVGHRLLESTAESKVLSATLQERMRSISELTEARSKAQAEIGVLGAKLESKEKESLSLQYEIQVLNKQLVIRNEEREYFKRETEIAQKQQQEGFKRNQILESECQRLRALVKRKLPSPAAVAQMKQEVDAWGRDERRRSLGSRGESQGRLSGGSKDFQVQLLAERVLSMEEETKMLREVLAQKNNELAAARSYANSECASSIIRGGLKPRALLNSPGGGGGAGAGSEPSVSGENASAADAWASSLISELDSFRKPGSSSGGSPGILVGDSKFQMMDDFAEMEQLASVKEEERSSKEEAPKKIDDDQKEEQLLAANRLCMEISSKLLATEKELAEVREKNSASEASLVKLQEKLDSMLEQSKDQKNQDQQGTESIQANVQKVICLVEALAHAIGVDHGDDGHSLNSPGVMSSSSSSSMSEQSNSNSSGSFERLAMASKVGLSEFMGELSSALDLISTSFSKEFEERFEVKKLREEVNRLKVEKELLHASFERSGQRIGEVESQLADAEKIVGELREDLSGSSQYINELEERIRAADATVGDLRERLRSSEVKHQEQIKQLGSRCEELENQIASISMNPNRVKREREEHFNENKMEEAAMKLAECHRTMLALGKQVKAPEKISQKGIESEKDDELSWSRIRLHGFEPETLACWSPPRGGDQEQFFEQNHHQQQQQVPRFQAAPAGAVDDSDSSWLYSAEQRRTVMRSPGRYLSKKSASTKNELSKSVNLPVTPKVQNSGSFSRFFSRNR